jgi:hypothetical protein
MSRQGMDDIIGRVRGLIAAGTAEYTLGTAKYWDADQIEQVLDRHRQDLVRHKMVREPSYIGGGSVVYTRLRSAYGQLEKPTSGSTVFFIEDSVGDDRGTATYTADFQLGIFDFDADTGGTALYLTARSYDIFGAAGEILEEWAASETRSFDFSTDGQSFSRSQKAAGLREQARAMRKRARIRKKNLRTES